MKHFTLLQVKSTIITLSIIGSSHLAISQNVGIGTLTPLSLMHVSDGNFLVTGTYQSGNSIEISGAGTRMFFNPKKSAFRAGWAENDQWDDANMGDFSVALGRSPLASGLYSFSAGYNTRSEGNSAISLGHDAWATNDLAVAIGYNAKASGEKSVAIGDFAQASGAHAVAFGYNPKATGEKSVSMGDFSQATGQNAITIGNNAIASGNYSITAGGGYLLARSFGEVAMGIFNTDYAPNSTTAYNANDRLFVIGNGTSSGARSNAVTVLKNGNVGIGNSVPASKLDITGTIKIVDGTQGAGKVLTSDANGLASWQPAVKKSYFCSFLYNAPAFIIPNNLETIANFGTPRYNNNMVYSGGTITVPDAGLYHFDLVATVNYGFANTEGIQIRTYVNGGLYDQYFSNILSTDMLLNAGDNVVFKLMQLTGGNVQLSAFSRINGHKVY